ncbi:hypothetical protein GU249_08830 [Acinetobacter baumannii]|nr:hypothetical protein [Acinetobacter baumannii]
MTSVCSGRIHEAERHPAQFDWVSVSYLTPKTHGIPFRRSDGKGFNQLRF